MKLLYLIFTSLGSSLWFISIYHTVYTKRIILSIKLSCIISVSGEQSESCLALGGALSNYEDIDKDHHALIMDKLHDWMDIHAGKIGLQQ